MLSVSKLLDAAPLPKTGPARYSRPGPPVVVWNLTRRCSLKCLHCYNSSGEGRFPGELTTKEAVSLIDDLSGLNVPAIIFSGGDPLLRKDIFKLMAHAKAKQIRAILSTNGVAIDKATAGRIKKAGADYVGVSLDGGEDVNDSVRGVKGAFNKALDGIRRCRDAGLTVGVRFTMSKRTAAELPRVFELIEKEEIPRGYFSHLVYSGRGEKFSKEALTHNSARGAVDFIFEKAAYFIGKGIRKDIVTGSNDADGVYLYLKIKSIDPERAKRVYGLLLARGGNTSGTAIGNIDNLGEVHPDQFWSSRSIGNIRKKSFTEIWLDEKNPLLNALRNRKGLIKGRCALCRYLDICGGNYRVRAEFATGDAWAEDPACYLTDEEVLKAP